MKRRYPIGAVALVCGLMSIGAVGATAVSANAVTAKENASAAVTAAAASSVIPRGANSAWVYDGKSGAGVWSSTILNYNQLATDGHKITQLYTYGSDVESDSSTASGFTSYYTAGVQPSESTTAYNAQLNIAPGLTSSPSPVQLSPIIDGQIGSDSLPGSFNSMSTTSANALADQIAQQVCADDNVSGIQFDIEPFNVTSTTTGQYPFYLQIGKDFAGSGCVNATHPLGRYFSVFAFGSAINPATPSGVNVASMLNTYHNGYFVDSLYDLGTGPAGALNSPDTYAGLVGTETTNTVQWARQLGINYAFGIPAAASDHEYTTCQGSDCVAGTSATGASVSGAPMLSYVTAAVNAINAQNATTDPLYVGTDLWDFGAGTGTSLGKVVVTPAAAQVDVLKWLAVHLPGATAASSPPADTTAPTVPTGLALNGSATSTTIPVTWAASTDAVGVAGYRIYTGTTKLADVTGTSTTLTGLTPSTAYPLTVTAYDAAGNESAKSAVLNATTAASGTTPPASNLVTDGGFESGGLASWSCVTGTGAVVTGHAQTGNDSLALTPTSTVTAECTQNVTVVAGKSYTVSAALAGGTNSIALTLKINGSTVNSSGSAYATKSFTFTAATSGQIQLSLSAYKQQSGTGYVDDVSLTANS
ncbi:fibronectin type III domain-containing protein [Subtercola lobariae]|uniref:Fibronectin type-III domain-containing protein n=1 Tax=Subtercola lobariae TaxID=1588641 RepID=A0A917ET97_9MICO|nr:carbohydrate binding domain-containing protein [Subtercola lobariae]GGF10459.1 hypothetical protein GCM10011399_00400 [Subtercola lobariae]